jgi:hypothetical protein
MVFALDWERNENKPSRVGRLSERQEDKDANMVFGRYMLKAKLQRDKENPLKTKLD